MTPFWQKERIVCPPGPVPNLFIVFAAITAADNVGLFGAPFLATSGVEVVFEPFPLTKGDEVYMSIL
jgi:hypothetical protein